MNNTSGNIFRHSNSYSFGHGHNNYQHLNYVNNYSQNYSNITSSNGQHNNTGNIKQILIQQYIIMFILIIPLHITIILSLIKMKMKIFKIFPFLFLISYINENEIRLTA
jgi:hypothetical protein